MKSFERLLDILVTLRSPEGCPWDRKQTAHSLKNNLIEESYEAIDAIDSGNSNHVKEELGDLYLLVTMISLIEEEQGKFTVSDALDDVSEKLVRRHPHVFADVKLETAEQVLKQWNEIKETVEGREKKESVLDTVSRALPPLERAFRIQKEVSKKGFDWKDSEDVWKKIHEELRELHEAQSVSREKIEDEVGDVLFSVINICRFHKIDPSVALHRTNEKFIRRFKFVEKSMQEKGLEMNSETFPLMDELWDEAKKSENQGST